MSIYEEVCDCYNIVNICDYEIGIMLQIGMKLGANYDACVLSLEDKQFPAIFFSLCCAMDIMNRGWYVYSSGFIIFLCLPVPNIM